MRHLATALLIGGAMLGLAGSASAQEGLIISDVRVGFARGDDDYYKVGVWVPVTVDIQVRDFDFTGVIAIDAADASGAWTELLPHRPDVMVEGVEAFAGSADWAEGAGFMGLIALTLASSVSLVLRFRRSDRQVRQQVKWFLFAVGLLLLTAVLAGLVELLGFQAPEWLPDILFLVSLLSLPAATGVAILRYRLYDIDRVINQTVVYGLLTAALVGIYVGAVAGIGSAARALTGQESNSLVIVVSTLAVAALFRPLRARFQTFIDLRFYRQRYDAAATLDGFSARLRDQVDLESLRGEIVAVVGTTMQPAHASLWLRAREEA